MPGSIRLTVLDAFDITEAAGGDGVFVRASMGKKQFTTRVAETMGGKAGPWDDEHAFSVLSLTDHLIVSLLTASGKSLGSTQVTTPSIVEKGFRDEVLGMKDGKGHVVGQVHVKLSFVLSDEERKKIEAMRAKSLAKKGEGQNASDAPVVAPSDSVSSPSQNGKRSSSSKFSFNKAIGNGQSPGEADPAAVMAELSQEVNAEVAKASTAAFQATADVAKQAQEAAASGPQEVASRASQTAQKATQVSEKAAGIAATAAEQAASSAGAGNGRGKWDEDTPPSAADEGLLRRPSVKERVAALESPTGGSSLGDGAQDDDAEEARLAEEDWQRAEAVEEALRAAEQRKREEDSKKVGKAAAEAKRYEQEYREQRQREEERKRKEAEKKKEQERKRAAKAAAEARQEAERRAEEEQRRAEREEGGEEEAEEGAFSKVWQQVGGTLAFVVALFVLWPRDSRKGVVSRRRVKLSGDTYVVKKGDTLDNIVGRMCYNPNSEFYKLNPEVCDRNTIYPGQVLRVPEYQ